MSEVRRLTKADLLLGKEQVHYVYFPELKAELPLRPLTEGENAQIESLRMKGMNFKGSPELVQAISNRSKDGLSKEELMSKIDFDFDIVEQTAAEFEADCLTVFFGIAGDDTPDWTIDSVKQMRPVGIVEKIANEIYKISGIKEDVAESVSNFLEDKARPGDSKSSINGV